MGAGASAEAFEQDGFSTAFETIDHDESGSVDREEFKVAAKSLGIHLSDADAEAAFVEFDADSSGLVDQEEFVRFCVAHALKARGNAELPAGTDTSSIASHLSAENAQHGFRTAHLILDKNSKAASQPMQSKPPPGSSPWYPLHYLLCLDAAAYARNSSSDGDGGGGASSAAAATAAFQAAAEPLILRVIELFPDAAAMRVMEGVRFSMGNLPVEYAISRGWHANVVEALLKAHPAAATSLDPAKNAKKFDAKSWKPESVKGCRWLRKIAEECVPAAHDDVLGRRTPAAWVDQPLVGREAVVDGGRERSGAVAGGCRRRAAVVHGQAAHLREPAEEGRAARLDARVAAVVAAAVHV